MTNNHTIRELLEATAYDVNGEKLGKVNEVYINDASGQPDFVEVNHGLFGLGSSLVPLRGHSVEGEELRLAFEKDRVKDAPKVDAENHLSNEEQAELYRHYGLTEAKDVTSYEREAAGLAGAPVEHEARHERDEHVEQAKHAAEAPASADNEIIRSEERLNVDTQREAAGEVRLHKYVVQETETIEVPVEREEVTVTRTPIDADEAARIGDSQIGEQDASVTLYEDRVSVSKETVPVEKVSLGKETVRDTETVSEQVAKERIDTGDIEGTVRDEK